MFLNNFFYDGQTQTDPAVAPAGVPAPVSAVQVPSTDAVPDGAESKGAAMLMASAPQAAPDF